MDAGISTIAAALLAAHKSIFGKERRVGGHDRYNEKVQLLKQNLDAGLVGDLGLFPHLVKFLDVTIQS